MSPENPLSVNQVSDIVASATDVVVMQADNPDGDSLGSALALEEILSDFNKNIRLYCGIDIPNYLHYLSGWDRVSKELPKNFDLAIIVDASSLALFETLSSSRQQSLLKGKSVLVIDHHATAETFPFDVKWYQKPAVATAELIYELAKELSWPMNLQSKKLITSAIMSDSLGLTSEATTAKTVRIVADLVEEGVNLAELENTRRQLMKKRPELVSYKGELLQRIEYWDDGRIATISIPWKEIETYSPMYNPSMLVLDEMRMIENVQVAIAFKTYQNGKVTAKIRTNTGFGIADKLALNYGGGGHSYASGFKTKDNTDFSSLKSEVIVMATKLLSTQAGDKT